MGTGSMTNDKDDDLYFAWVLRTNAHRDLPDFMPIVFREGVAPSGITHVYAKWKLRRHERWMSLDQLREIYPLKAVST
jgi:hypothetical protein